LFSKKKQIKASELYALAIEEYNQICILVSVSTMPPCMV